jgi:Protein of unknown function (DUF3999)
VNRAYRVGLGLTLMTAGRLAGAVDRPGDFAYGVPIEVTQSAAAYRVALPLDVYIKSTHVDLRDIRVFNADGEVVPYEIQQAPAGVAPPDETTPLPLFALRGDAQPALTGLRVTIQSSATSVNLQAGATPAQDRTITSYLLDARQISGPLYALQLQWPEDAADFTGSVRVEAADDLTRLHEIISSVTVINLHGSGARLVQNRIDLNGSKAKFWRLTWIGKAAPFEVTSVNAQTTPDRREPQTVSLTVKGIQANAKPQEYSFDLGARLPVTKIDLLLPQENSVATVQLLSRNAVTDSWRSIIAADFFRLGEQVSDRHNRPFEIGQDSDRFWLARFERAPAASSAPPQLQVKWDAQDIVFLARGPGPYQLAYGNAAVTAASSPLGALLAGMNVVKGTAGAPTILGGADRMTPPPHTVAWKMTILWTILGSGMLLLAFMAYRLSRELMDQPPKPE